MIRTTLKAAAAAALAASWIAAALAGEETAKTEKHSPFAPSELRTADGGLADPDLFFEPEVCGECHVDQYADWKGSLHSRAHHDALYLAFANLARKEGGDDLYRFCSSCHAPGAVATREIPGGKDTEHTFLTDDGVSCDICHSVKEVRTLHAGGGANASIVLEQEEIRYGPIEKPSNTPAHESAYSETHTKSRLCSACHTLTHPHNGVVIENTYAEWAASPYAAAGIQCQDCHMRTPGQAAKVARTMKPLKVPGATIEGGEPRENVYSHLFVGANTNHELVGASKLHGKHAVQRLRDAAAIEIQLPESAQPGSTADVVVAVTNVGAGHSIPTSITELRQAWIDLRVTDAEDVEIYRSGAVDETGKLDPAAVVYTSVLHDENGQVTYLPWRAAKLARENLIHAKETKHESYAIALPADARTPLRVTATLRYRSAPQDVLDELFGAGTLRVETVDMAQAAAVLPLR